MNTRTALLRSLLVGACFTASPVVASSEAAAPSSAPAADVRSVEEGRPSAMVVLDGHALFRVVGATGFPADERARAIGERLRAFAQDGRRPTSELRTIRYEHYTVISAGDDRIAAVHDVDAVQEGLHRDTLAEINLKRVQEAVERYRAQREPRYLLRQGGHALGATVLLLLAVGVVRWGERRMKRAIERRISRLLAAVEGKSRSLVRARWLGAVVRSVVGAAATVLVVFAVLFYLGYVLELFPWTWALGKRLVALFLGPLEALGQGLLEALPGIAFLVVLVFVVSALLRFIRLAFQAVQSGNVQFEGFDPDWAEPTYKIVRLLVIVFALVVAYPYVPGSGSQAFKGISIMLGVMLSLGSSSIISNLIAGYAMTYRRTFRRGDVIQVGDKVGRVTEVRLQVTHLRNMRNEEIIVPNSEILGSSVVNYTSLSHDQGLYLNTTVGIGYEVPWRQVESMLLMAAGRTPGIRSDPPPFVLEKSLGDFCIVYELNAAIDDPGMRPQQYAALHRNVLDVFNEYDVQIMTPAYEGDPAEPKVVPKARWYSAPAQATAQDVRSAPPST